MLRIRRAKPIARMNWLGISELSSDPRYRNSEPTGKAHSRAKLSCGGLPGRERIRKIFLNSDIDYRHLYLEGALNREESSDQLNQRYLRGAMKTGLPRDFELCESSRYYSARCRFPCSLHGYVCPDVGSRLIAQMGFSNNLQRASAAGHQVESHSSVAE